MLTISKSRARKPLVAEANVIMTAGRGPEGLPKTFTLSVPAPGGGFFTVTMDNATALRFSAFVKERQAPATW